MSEMTISSTILTPGYSPAYVDLTYTLSFSV